MEFILNSLPLPFPFSPFLLFFLYTFSFDSDIPGTGVATHYFIYFISVFMSWYCWAILSLMLLRVSACHSRSKTEQLFFIFQERSNFIFLERVRKITAPSPHQRKVQNECQCFQRFLKLPFAFLQFHTPCCMSVVPQSLIYLLHVIMAFVSCHLTLKQSVK